MEEAIAVVEIADDTDGLLGRNGLVVLLLVPTRKNALAEGRIRRTQTATSGRNLHNRNRNIVSTSWQRNVV